MRIGIDGNSLSDPKRTGIGRYSVAILRQFFALAPDHDYYLYSAQPIDHQIKKEWSRYSNVFFRESNFPSRYVWKLLFSWRWLKKDNLDVYFTADGLLPLKCKVPGVAVVQDLIWYHFPKTAAPHIYLAFRCNLRRSVRKAYHCVASSSATKNDLVEYSKIPSSKVDVIYLGVEKRFKPEREEDVVKVLREYSIHSPYIFFIGNLMMHKNLIRLIQAYKIFIEAAKNNEQKAPSLVIAGCKNWGSSKILEVIRTMKLEDSVSFLGYVKDEDLVALYSAAELFVFPSLIEGFGLPILEAQACGAPVVCSRSSSLPEIAGDSVLFFDPRNAKDIAEKMSLLYSNDELRKELVQKGFENVKGFSWQKCAEQILPILEKAGNVK